MIVSKLCPYIGNIFLALLSYQGISAFKRLLAIHKVKVVCLVLISRNITFFSFVVYLLILTKELE